MRGRSSQNFSAPNKATKKSPQNAASSGIRLFGKSKRIKSSLLSAAHHVCPAPSRIGCGAPFRHEHHRTFRADQEQRRSQVADVPHGVVGVMLRLRQKVIQIFESVRLHSQGFAGNRGGGQDGFWAKISVIDSKHPAGLPTAHDQSGCLPAKPCALHKACQPNGKT